MNKQIDYLSIVREAWQIAWKNKYLWWFGLLVSLSGGFGYNFSSGDWGKQNGWEKNLQQKIYDWATLHGEWIVWGGLLLFVLMLVFLTLNILGRGALIASLSKTIAKESVNFKTGVREGRKFFWKILGLNFFLFSISLAALIILGTPVAILFYLKAYFLGIFLALGGLLIFILLAILFSYLQKFGIIYLVLGKVSFWAALENAYGIFRRNLLPSLIMGIIFIPLGFLAGLVTLIFVLVGFLIFLIPGLLAYFLAGKWTLILLAIVGGLILLIGILAINSIYAVFAQVVWILFFRQIALPKEENRIVNVNKEIKESEIIPVADGLKTLKIDK